MLKIILVALDSSDPSTQIIRTLNMFQLQSETKVILAHVIPPPEPDLERPADQPDVYLEASPYQHIEKQLKSHQAELPCQSELEIVSGDPADEIVRLAHIYHATLIVIGSRGLTGVKRILKRSVSSQVVADAPCSVLVIKPSESATLY